MSTQWAEACQDWLTALWGQTKMEIGGGNLKIGENMALPEIT